MSQDRLTEGGRSIVWKAVQEALEAHRERSGPSTVARLREALKVGSAATRQSYGGLAVSFQRLEGWGGEAWQPGDPDGGPTEQEIQKLIADIAADTCRRVEEALDQLDPPEPVVKSAAARARKAWSAEEGREYLEPIPPESVGGIVPEEDRAGFVGPPEPAESKRRCPHDGGVCHHHCAEGECYREAAGMALSTPYEGYPLPGHAIDGKAALKVLAEPETVKPCRVCGADVGPPYAEGDACGACGAVVCFVCSTCGVTKADEDGCCAMCGADCAIETRSAAQQAQDEVVDYFRGVVPRRLAEMKGQPLTREALEEGARLVKEQLGRPLDLDLSRFRSVEEWAEAQRLERRQVRGEDPAMDRWDDAAQAEREAERALAPFRPCTCEAMADNFYVPGEPRWTPTPAEPHHPDCPLYVPGEPNPARLEGPPEPRWQVWKKRYHDGWMTHEWYRHLDLQYAERQAEGFKHQMSVVDVAVLPVGTRPVEPPKPPDVPGTIGTAELSARLAAEPLEPDDEN
jgi:hypothetical protein